MYFKMQGAADRILQGYSQSTTRMGRGSSSQTENGIQDRTLVDLH